MGIKVKQANTVKELDELFHTRHDVFVDEMKYNETTEDGRLFDRFDTYPTTANIVVIMNGIVAGGVRAVPMAENDSPFDHYFDFRPHLPKKNSRVACGGMLLIKAEYRSVPNLTFYMLGMFYQWAIRHNMTHIVALAAPVAESLFLDQGFVPLSARIPFPLGPEKAALPVVLDIEKLSTPYLEFARRHAARYLFDCPVRQFYAEGETILREGERGEAAYLVISGEVALTAKGSAAGPKVDRRGRGEVFGELTLLTGPTSQLSAVAVSAVELLVVEREQFAESLVQNPKVALDLLQVVGERLGKLSL